MLAKNGGALEAAVCVVRAGGSRPSTRRGQTTIDKDARSRRVCANKEAKGQTQRERVVDVVGEKKIGQRV